MAITSQVSQLEFSGNNSSSIPYALAGLRFDDNSWLVVEEITTAGSLVPLVAGVDFTVTGSGAASSASVITSGRAIPTTSILRVSRVTPATQEARLSATGSIPSATLERMADKLTMTAQDLARLLAEGESRSLRLPAGEIAQEIPTDRGGKILYFDEDGSVAVLTPAGLLALSGGVVPNGQGVPPGGLMDEVLAKASSLSGDVEWQPRPTSNNVIPPGPFTDDEEAYREGVRFGQLYRDDTGAPKLRGLVAIGKVAFLGDSQTAFGSWKPSIFAPGTTGNSYWPWFATLAGGAFELVPNPNTGSLAYALGGLRSNEFATLVSQVCASDADYVFVMVGTNDVLSSYTVETTVSNIMDLICAPILEANKIPVVLAMYSMALTIPGNASGQLSAKILQIRDALKVRCAEVSIPYYDPNSAIETSPGVGDASWFADPTNVHLDPVGAIVFARQFLILLRQDLSFGFDPLSNTDWLNSNADFSAGSTTPTGYFRNPSPPGDISGESIITVEGEKWWEFTLTPSGASTSIVIGTNAANTETPAGLTVDAICLLEVTSGAVKFGSFILQDNTSATVVWALSDFNVKKAYIRPQDGPILISPLTTGTVAGGITNIRPLLSFAVEEPTTLRLRLLTARKY